MAQFTVSFCDEQGSSEANPSRVPNRQVRMTDECDGGGDGGGGGAELWVQAEGPRGGFESGAESYRDDIDEVEVICGEAERRLIVMMMMQMMRWVVEGLGEGMIRHDSEQDLEAIPTRRDGAGGEQAVGG